jgi:hypothetical protein
MSFTPAASAPSGNASDGSPVMTRSTTPLDLSEILTEENKNGKMLN